MCTKYTIGHYCINSESNISGIIIFSTVPELTQKIAEIDSGWVQAYVNWMLVFPTSNSCGWLSVEEQLAQKLCVFGSFSGLNSGKNMSQIRP